MRCYSCRKYDDCERPWKCDEKMYDCSAYEVEQTNEEWIKSLNTEQLAEFLDRLAYAMWLDKHSEFSKMNCKEDWEMWLKQPHQ